MEASELDRRLWCIEVEVKYRLSDSPSTKHAVRVKQTDTFRKIKKHVTESLDIQGRMMYGDQNCDEVPNKRLSDYSSRPEETFLLMAERKQRDMKHYAVKLQIPEEYLMKDDDRMMEIKVARTTTISNLPKQSRNTSRRAKYTCTGPAERMSAGYQCDAIVATCNPGSEAAEERGRSSSETNYSEERSTSEKQLHE